MLVLLDRPKHYKVMTLISYISNSDDFEALIELEGKSDNMNELTNLDVSTLCTELQTKEATTAYKTRAEFTTR